MRRFTCCLVLVIACQLDSVDAQTRVQLPTVRTFGVQTSVSVPDRGMTHLGGVTRARAGSQSLGAPLVGRLPGIGRPFQQRGFGTGLGTNQSFVRAQIIDLEAMDQAVLAEARANKVPRAAAAPQATALHQHLGRTQRSAVAPKPLPVRSSDATTQQLLDLGDAALEAGDYERATQYYAAAEQRTLGNR